MNPNLQKQTVLLVGHGSREASGNQEILAFADAWRQRQPQHHVEVCFIEFADVLLDDGLDTAAQRGGQVVVVPLILNAAGHVKMEIPEHIEHARLRHPAVEFIYCRHLSACDEILTAMKRNLSKAMHALDVPDPRNTGVIVLGRGSSDRVANGEVAKIARWLYEETDHDLVDIAFTGITHPRLESVVQRQIKQEMRQIVVLPFYLFTGTLIERIRRQVERLQSQYPQVNFTLGHYLGFENEIYDLLEQRIAEATTNTQPMMMECDGCKYREFAADHGHGHHHPA
ncbi:sirohydrochlorin chelatase [Methylomarinum vadi]|uniref:sirohydrochlorin chelatase n=1 Tax=Methylomarinum vadi TaxID=438855 RepID=UPI0004DF9717|nr:sirohydrochlorin chelatase [Methylomarinum vadi]